MIRLAHTALVTVVGGLPDVQGVGNICLGQCFFFAQISKSVVLHMFQTPSY